MTKLKIYTEGFDTPLLKDVPLVPFIHGLLRDFDTSSNNLLPWQKRYFRYWMNSPNHLASSSFEDCDLVVLPYDWSWVRGHHWRRHSNSVVSRTIATLSQVLYQKAISHQKPVIVFFAGDRSHEAIPFPKATIFRQSIYQSRRSHREFAFPAFSEDIVQQVSHLQQSEASDRFIVRPKRSVPSIGFCGLATSPNLKTRLTDLVYHLYMLISQGYLDVSPHKGEALRTKAIKILKDSSKVNTNFILRKKSVFFSSSLEQKKTVRYDYIKNILDSDYVLCCRGSGNFSLRIYETLCMGRIPLLINTDSCFPYDFENNWKQYCIWVEEKDLKFLPQRVLDFHNSLSPEAYEDLQRRCRDLWETRLSPQGFFGKLHRHFSNLQSCSISK